MLKPDLFITPAPPTDVSLSQDNLTLSVCVKERGTEVKVLFYDVRLLAVKVSERSGFRTQMRLQRCDCRNPVRIACLVIWCIIFLCTTLLVCEWKLVALVAFVSDVTHEKIGGFG